jgi:hypothetical protein
MLISLLLVTIAAAGGFAITYMIEKDEPLMWRLAAGNVIGSALFGTVAFFFALLFGLNPAVVVGALALAALPALLFLKAANRKRLGADWSRAKSRLQGAGSAKALRLAYYTFFFLLFFFFIDRAMLESAAGIYTGGSQNLGDLPLHLGTILSFTEANNFPPQNPSFAGAKFSYPFISDFLTACAVKVGASVRDAMFVQNLLWMFSLLIILERFVFKLANDKLVARLAPPLLFFSGGLGFIWFLGDYWAQSKSFFGYLSAMPKDYTISDSFRWGNSMVVLFITQRSLLLGMPLTLIVLGYLWKEFTSAIPPADVASHPRLRFVLSPFLVGLIAGLLPLIHLHSLAVLFVVGLCLFILQPEKWLTWILFAAGVAVIAVPELIWSITGSASQTTKFFEWHFGWDKGDKNFFWFWLVNTGLVIPLLLAGLYLVSFVPTPTPKEPKKKKDRKSDTQEAPQEHSPLSIQRAPLLWFYIPFALLFVVSNIAKLAPWEWDNIKVLIYWFVGSLPLIGIAIAWMRRNENGAIRIAALICFLVLTASGALDVWRVVSGQINYKIFDSDAVEIASQIRVRTPLNALFLNAPTYNSAVVLSGRQSLMRYSGHLLSHGIDYRSRESVVTRIYQGGPEAAALMEKNGIEYVLVSPEERLIPNFNEQFFSRYPVAAESGQYRVYKIK